MKKLYLSVIAILIPVIVYISIFFCNDPHGYFSGDPNDTTLIGRMLDYQNGSYNAILFGDSRVDNMDMSGLNQATSLNFKNMAYGGATSREIVSLFWWCMDQQTQPIQEVIIVTGFQSVNAPLQQDRVASTKDVLQTPLNYALSFDNASDFFSKLSKGMEGEDDETVPVVYDEEQKQKNMQTHRDSLLYYLENYAFDEDVISDLTEIGLYCNEHGIKVRFILPPWWEGYYELLDEHDLKGIIDEYKRKLSYGADVWDLEYEECALNANYEDFNDYTHFTGKTEEIVQDTIINESKQYARIWRNGEIIYIPQ